MTHTLQQAKAQLQQGTLSFEELEASLAAGVKQLVVDYVNNESTYSKIQVSPSQIGADDVMVTLQGGGEKPYELAIKTGAKNKLEVESGANQVGRRIAGPNNVVQMVTQKPGDSARFQFSDAVDFIDALENAREISQKPAALREGGRH